MAQVANVRVCMVSSLSVLHLLFLSGSVAIPGISAQDLYTGKINRP
jgi:hypothetical protein